MSCSLSFGSRVSLAALLATGALLGTPPAAAQEAGHEHVLGDRLGTVEFPVACAEAVQEDFNRAMALYHSFAWSHAGEAFEAIAQEDPTCGMAHWGRAMVMLDHPFLGPGSLPPEKLARSLRLWRTHAAPASTMRARKGMWLRWKRLCVTATALITWRE